MNNMDMDMNINLANYYFPLLNTLSSKAKLYLATKLMDSLLKDGTLPETSSEREKDIAFRRLAGAWANDPEADAMASFIRDGRTSNHTRQLTSFDE